MTAGEGPRSVAFIPGESLACWVTPQQSRENDTAELRWDRLQVVRWVIHWAGWGSGQGAGLSQRRASLVGCADPLRAGRAFTTLVVTVFVLQR